MRAACDQARTKEKQIKRASELPVPFSAKVGNRKKTISFGLKKRTRGLTFIRLYWYVRCLNTCSRSVVWSGRSKPHAASAAASHVASHCAIVDSSRYRHFDANREEIRLSRLAAVVGTRGAMDWSPHLLARARCSGRESTVIMTHASGDSVASGHIPVTDALRCDSGRLFRECTRRRQRSNINLKRKRIPVAAAVAHLPRSLTPSHGVVLSHECTPTSSDSVGERALTCRTRNSRFDYIE